MNIKIQGGGAGIYANSGSCAAVVNYLEHEDLKAIKEGESVEKFFNLDQEEVSPQEILDKIDNNKGQLLKTDSKFFVLTVSPSQEEQERMGATKEERSKAFKEYIREGVMQQYAENFGKGLGAENIMFYAKIHHERGDKDGHQMHAHVIISRKDMDNKIKLSPQTSHRNTTKGHIKGGFDRSAFFEKCEKSFDQKFSYERKFKESYTYQNTMKNGTLEDVAKLEEKEKEFYKTQAQAQEQKQERRGGLELSL